MSDLTESDVEQQFVHAKQPECSLSLCVCAIYFMWGGENTTPQDGLKKPAALINHLEFQLYTQPSGHARASTKCHVGYL